MEIKEINELTHNWTADEFADFLHYLLQHGDHESMRGWWRSTSLLRKLEAAGLAGSDGGEVALTPAGAELKRALYLLEMEQKYKLLPVVMLLTLLLKPEKPLS